MNSFADKLIWFGTLGAIAGILVFGSQNPFDPGFLWRGLGLLVFGCTVIAMGGWQLYKNARKTRPIQKEPQPAVWAAATGDATTVAVDESSKKN